jgi:hypothetical protein
MKQYLMWTTIGGGLLIGVAGLAFATAEMSKGPVFIAGDQPVSEDQVRQKLQSQRWSDIQISREGRYFFATASKDGHTDKVAVDSQTGRLQADDDDDD